VNFSLRFSSSKPSCFLMITLGIRMFVARTLNDNQCRTFVCHVIYRIRCHHDHIHNQSSFPSMRSRLKRFNRLLFFLFREKYVFANVIYTNHICISSSIVIGSHSFLSTLVKSINFLFAPLGLTFSCKVYELVVIYLLDLVFGNY
jgi:hypothetical protein